MKSVRFISASFSATVLACLLPAPAAAIGVPAGTVIENSAQVQYTLGTHIREATTNTDKILVDEVIDLSVDWRDGATVPVDAAGGILTFQVTNSGNGPEAFDINVERQQAGSQFDPTVTSIAYDSNGNGQYDPGVDLTILPGQSTPEIPADSSVLVFVLAGLSGDVEDGSTATISVDFAAATGVGAPGTAFDGRGSGGGRALLGPTAGFTQSQGSVIALVSDVALVKSVKISDPYGGKLPVSGARATYSILTVVGGSAKVDALTVSDRIPAGTSYVPGTLTLDNRPLTDAAGDDLGEFNNASIAVALGTVPGGESHTISFQVTIN